VGNTDTARKWSEAALAMALEPELLQKVHLPAIRALRALNRGNYSGAIVELRAAILAGVQSMT
jgi:hypothetical protein